MKWAKTRILSPDGAHEAIAPLVISASRSTDIPAFYAEWFMGRLRAGYVKWVNPFNQRPTYVSFESTRAIVFWSKNPEPLVRHLLELDDRGIAYYFQFTLNDYDEERFEPHVPCIEERAETFIALSESLGRDRVVWRFDPLILTDELTVDCLLDKIRRVGEMVHRHTTKLIFSFADIAEYRKVRSSIARSGVAYRDIGDAEMMELARGISELCRRWGLQAVTCGEQIDLSGLGIQRNRCIDDELLLSITGNDPALMKLFGHTAQPLLGDFGDVTVRTLKDPGQRAECGCVFSKDIGQYNTCPHLCVYCYANTSPETVQRNIARCHPENESIV